MQQSVVVVLLGAVLGFLSGLFGVGGSSVATPLLRLLNVPRLVALATPLPVTLPTAVVGAFAYWREGRVNVRAALWTAAGGVPTVIAGSYLTSLVPGRLLMLLTGGFVVAVGVRLLGSAAPQEATCSRIAPAWQYAAVGLGVGLLSGLLANGGGFLLVPAYLLLFRMEAQEAAATSLVSVALLALPGTWVHWQMGHIDPRLAGLLAVGVVPSTYFGAALGVRISAERARRLFGWFLLLFGFLFLLRTIYRAEMGGWSG